MTDVSPRKILATLIFATWMNTWFYHKQLFSAKHVAFIPEGSKMRC